MAEASGIDFNSVNPIGTIQDGDNYDFVALHDTATVTMKGGTINESLYAFDTSIFNFQGGNLSGSYFHGFSTFNISGGTILGGILMYENSVLNITGGFVSGADMGVSTILNLYGGDLGHFYVQNIVNIYASDLSVVSLDPQEKMASGHWGDGTSFQFRLGRTQSYNTQINFYEIPEPSTIFLIGFGIAFVIRKTNK
jgi:hypothetical protein